MLRSDPTKTPFVIAAGVLGSLIASFLMLCIAEIVLGPSRDEQAMMAERLDAALRTLHDTTSLFAHATRHGIDTIKPKADYTMNEWIEVLRGAHEKLVLIGHALDKWCAEDVRPVFEETIERLARDDKTVQLITLPLEGANITRISRQRGKDYSRRIQTTLETVTRVHERLPVECRQALSVRSLVGEVDMAYMLVATENVVITCAYPTAALSSDSMLTITADPEKPFGQAVREDVRQLVDRYTEVVQLLPSD